MDLYNNNGPFSYIIVYCMTIPGTYNKLLLYRSNRSTMWEKKETPT